MHTGLAHYIVDLQNRPIDLEEALKERMMEASALFTLKSIQMVAGNEVTTILRFDKSESSDYYSFHGYHVAVRLHNEGKLLGRYFNVKVYKHKGTRNPNITFAEAVKLFLGGSVCKEALDKDQKVKEVWLKADFLSKKDGQNYDILVFDPEEGYNFNLTSALKELPIIQTYDCNELEVKLKRGEQILVPIKADKMSFSLVLGVNAAAKDLDFWNREGRLLTTEAIARLKSYKKPHEDAKEERQLVNITKKRTGKRLKTN